MGLLVDLLSDIKHSIPPDDVGTLIASQIGKTNHRIGITHSGGVAVLFSLPPIVGSSPPSTHLENLKVDYYLECEIKDPMGDVTMGEYSIIECTSDNEEIQNIFLRIIEDHLEDIGEKPNAKKMNNLIHNLTDLFSQLNASGSEILGLWGELFLMAQLEKPEIWVDNWHNDPKDTYDFVWVANAVEVKTSLSDERIHHFSLRQLRPRDGLNVKTISILTKKSEFGVSVLDLVEAIERRLHSNKLREKLRNLVAKIGGNTIADSTLKFDYAKAISSLNIYESINIPAVVLDDKLRVKGVNFQVELDGISSEKISLNEIY